MKIGVSSCLMGMSCRYDGSGCKDDFIFSQLGKFADFVPVCPEAEIFPTPREAIRLVNDGGSVRVVTSNTKRDVTDELDAVSQTLARGLEGEGLSGYILKSKSPSCGMERVKVYQSGDAPSIKEGVGRFAAQLKVLYPYLPIEEEGRLHDPWLKENFLMQVFAYDDIKRFIASSPRLNDLVEFHTAYKYLIYAKSHESYKALGHIVANHEKKPFETILCEYEELFLQTIALKGNIGKTYNILLHIYGYFKNDITAGEKELLLQSLEEYKDGIIPLIAIIKLINLYVVKFDIGYLAKQKFLDPYPKELALRSDLKAYK